ncbi:hypothetical protein ES703_68608 [subsurface metagenome]
MPVIFEIPDVLVLNKFGKFIAVTPPGFTIPAANAVSVTGADTGGWLAPYNRNLNLYAPVTIPIPEGWAAIVERFNWGCSDNDGRIFYEVWQEPGALIPYMIEEKFHCCGVVTSANTDNRSTHPSAAVQLEFRMWNRSLTLAEFPAAVDAHVEISGWVYLFRLEFLDEILKTSTEAGYKRLEKYFNDIMNALGALKGAPPPPMPPT